MKNHRYRYNPASDYKTRKRGSTLCNHIEDKKGPHAVTPSGKKIGKCIRCNGPFDIDAEAKRRKGEEIKEGLDFDQALRLVKIEVANKRYRRNYYHRPRYED